MSSRRLQKRCLSARALGSARLPHYRLAMNKLGSDGSAKANIVRAKDMWVWGVLYQLHGNEFQTLDEIENNYKRITMTLENQHSENIQVHTYVSDFLTDNIRPFDWYKEHMLQGAREHGLPPEHIALLEAIPARQMPVWRTNANQVSSR